MNNRNSLPRLVCAACTGYLVGSVCAVETSLAEDPFEVARQSMACSGERPWEGRKPDEIRAWAKKHLHAKLTARSAIEADAHPEWAWFRRSGLGLFLHWGPAGVPPNNGDAWAMVWSEQKVKYKRRMILPEEMFKVVETWNPKRYDPDKWMAAAAQAGFGYAVLTTRHHDGYCLWPSAYGSWDTGGHMNGRDLVKAYVEACRKNGIRTGFYYSSPNWHFDYKNKDFSWPPRGINYIHEKVERDPPLAALMGYVPPLPGDGDRLEREESARQVRELMTRYGPIDMMWWDGNSIMSEQELAELQPDIFVARGNIATPEGRHHGKSERLKVTNAAGWWWELCIKSENKDTPYWHYNAGLETNHWNAGKLLTELVRCRSLGGNLLVNITPRPNGEMMDWYYEVCDEMAAWMKHSREAVYDVDLDAPLPTLDKTLNYTTVRDNTWYSLPNERSEVFIHNVGRPNEVTLLRTGEEIDFEFRDGALRVVVPESRRTALPDLVRIDF